MAAGAPGNYPMPIPVRQKSGSGCLIGGLVGCGVLLVAAIVLVVFVVKNAPKNGLFRSAGQMVAATQNAPALLSRVGVAIDGYAADHKLAYPKSLYDLIPKYLPDKSAITYTMGDTSVPMVYNPPTGKSPSDAIVVSIKTADFTMVKGMTQSSSMCLLKDGSVAQVTRQTMPTNMR